MHDQICGVQGSGFKAQEQSFYGLLVDNMIDVSNEKQMLAFVQYFDVDLGRLECKFLLTANVLEEFTSADVTTLHGVITNQLQALKIPLKNLRGLATDGASVMTGKKQRPSNTAEERYHQLGDSSLHMPQASSWLHRHQLRTKNSKGSEDRVHTAEEIFDNSPKKIAAHLKLQQEMKQITLWGKANKRISKSLQNTVAIFGQCHNSRFSDLPSILQTLRQLKRDPSCYGLLKKFVKVKIIGTIYILCEVLPGYDQRCPHQTINHSLQEETSRTLVEGKSPIKKL